MSHGFWAHIDRQLLLLKTAKSAEDVITILGRRTSSTGDAFFAGGGGDGSIAGALTEAGWTVAWMEADYYWCMVAPDGSKITYVEGDVFRGNQRPLPHKEAEPK